MANRSREELLYLSRLAEQCDRFDGKYYNHYGYIQRWLYSILLNFLLNVF